MAQLRFLHHQAIQSGAIEVADGARRAGGAGGRRRPGEPGPACADAGAAGDAAGPLRRSARSPTSRRSPSSSPRRWPPRGGCSPCTTSRSRVLDGPRRATAGASDQGAPAVAFENVTFAYGPDEPAALVNVSFSVEPGQTVALVGRSGAGKTTAAHLLLRFWDPTTGRITLGGVDVRELELDALRQQVGLVAQDTYLFNASLGHNLKLARPDATDDDLDRATALANADALRGAAAGRLRDARRRAGRPSLGRPAPADRHCAGAAEGRADPGAGRGDLAPGRRQRASGARRARPADARPHDAGDRASPLDDPERRQDRRARRRASWPSRAPTTSCSRGVASTRGWSSAQLGGVRLRYATDTTGTTDTDGPPGTRGQMAPCGQCWRC